MKYLFFFCVLLFSLLNINVHAQENHIELNISRSNFYFVDTILIKKKYHFLMDSIFIGFPNEIKGNLLSIIIFSNSDTNLYYRNIITCDECIGRGTVGNTYKGHVVLDQVVGIKQTIFEGEIILYISLTEKHPYYSKIVTNFWDEKLHKKARKTYTPIKKIYLADFSFFDYDFNDPKLKEKFKIHVF
jgi:hypothetical protein